VYISQLEILDCRIVVRYNERRNKTWHDLSKKFDVDQAELGKDFHVQDLIMANV